MMWLFMSPLQSCRFHTVRGRIPSLLRAAVLAAAGPFSAGPAPLPHGLHPVAQSTLTLLLGALASATSRRPSALRSPTVSATGPTDAGYVTTGLSVPSPLPRN